MLTMRHNTTHLNALILVCPKGTITFISTILHQIHSPLLLYINFKVHSMIYRNEELHLKCMVWRTDRRTNQQNSGNFQGINSSFRNFRNVISYDFNRDPHVLQFSFLLTLYYMLHRWICKNIEFALFQKINFSETGTYEYILIIFKYFQISFVHCSL